MSGIDVTTYIGLGSNIGNREENLNQAVDMLRNAAGIKVTAVSTYFNTAPVGYMEQPDFLNAVVEASIDFTVYELLELCRNIEKKLKRERITHWGPRTIDVDILIFGDLILEDEMLIIPHPRMHEREFVLKPLNEIAPGVIHPVCNKSISKLYNEILLKSRYG
ncbi:2-amino-4-hydroxy-6-hydroxymethyldihydropteridine diphosphokinase [Halocella sp. SP3-1]|uniref:2-amino-4-hydroxy-6- hydroxymethyldihydropteridine diphosphokinase n=1 Tax=Halocella sp. SP3-1 TaxID=2382161 RepID=UPI000F74EA8B|nr:2-amino-4-hydroxy-6-hydroxymethyldihydropteridine diphosphokinase [Halocella sp. SP3-1]AZO94820.1 2-amino-4-hydroxy-6-hydroxymethyldihydropteridine diphosphokinase [Halocella sp. SP3-1]